ncbi:MAG: hypothetical protein ACXWCX_10230, partial [Burkholderiales bacterium]
MKLPRWQAAAHVSSLFCTSKTDAFPTLARALNDGGFLTSHIVLTGDINLIGIDEPSAPFRNVDAL